MSADRVGDPPVGGFGAIEEAAEIPIVPAELGDEGSATHSVYLPPYRVDVTVRCRVPLPVSRRRLATAIKATLEAAGAPGPSSIGLVLSDDADLTRLNAVHMGQEGPTDVLSFPFFPPEAYPPHESGAGVSRNHGVAAALKQAFALPPGLRAHLGDVVVSVERAVDQAQNGQGGQTGDMQWTVVEEMLLLTVHGTLHVCGWDHAEPVEEAAMRALERKVMACLAEGDCEEAGEGEDAGKAGSTG
jgi:probable rRNA maturation factor